MPDPETLVDTLRAAALYAPEGMRGSVEICANAIEQAARGNINLFWDLVLTQRDDEKRRTASVRAIRKGRRDG